MMMREGGSGEESVLQDPASLTDTHTTTFEILSISKDSRLMAFGVRTGADFFKTVKFLDVDRKHVLPDQLPRGSSTQVVFSPDGRGFYYCLEPADTDRPNHRAVYYHEFGGNPKNDVEVFCAGESSNIDLGLIASADSRRLGYLVTTTTDAVTFDLHIQDVVSSKRARKCLKNMRPVFNPFFVGHRLFALTDWKAPKLRIVSIKLNSPSRKHWLNIVPEAKDTIRDFAVVGNSIFVGYVCDATSRIEIYDQWGGRHGGVPCPPQGGARLLRRCVETTTLFYNYSSFHHPPTVLSFDVGTGRQEVWARSAVSSDSSSFEVEQIRYKSKDATEIPMFLAARKGWRSSGPLPTFLSAYGGFGTSRTPQFKAYSTFLIEQGFLFGFAHVRGGGEFGEEWHHAAQRHNRQVAFDDFIAAAEWLISQGYSIPTKICIGGGSNGALLVGSILTQRPDLFHAAICVGPLLDMLRYHKFDKAYMYAY